MNNKDGEGMRLKGALALLALAIVTVAAYSAAINGPFIFDDGMYIAKNPAIRDLALFWPPSGPRYLGYLSFALNYAAGGLDTFGYHLFNVIVHVLSSFLVFWITLLLFRTPRLKGAEGGPLGFPVALIASFLFATHPVQTQAVTYITQRFASMAALFYLLSLALYIGWRLSEGGWRPALYVLALASAVAAQLTKEIAFTLPAAIVLSELVFFGKEGFLKKVPALVPFVLTMGIVPLTIFGPEWGVWGGTHAGEATRELQIRDLTSISRYGYLVTEFRVIVTYLRLLVLPLGLNLDYDYQVSRTFFEPAVIASFMFLLAMFAGALYMLARGLREMCALAVTASAGVIFFFIALSIESSVIPINDVIYEHRLYLPNAGAALFAASAFMYLHKLLSKRAGLGLSALAWAVAVTAVVAAPLAAAAYLRNTVWADEITFWRDAVAKSPGKARVHNNLGVALYRSGEMREGMDEFRKAAELKPTYADARYNLGNAYKDMGLMEEALGEFEAAVRYDPSKTSARNNLGLAYFTLGRYAEAEAEFRGLVAADPQNYRAYTNLGLVYAGMGRTDDAEAAFRQALSIRPGHPEAVRELERLGR